MTQHATGTREEWLAARLELLQAEKDHTRRGDELAQWRRELPWVCVQKDYVLHTETATRRWPTCSKAARNCSSITSCSGPSTAPAARPAPRSRMGSTVSGRHLANHDVMLWAVSRAPLEKLQGYRRRMGWTFPWASSFGGDFNYDFDISLTEEQERAGAFEYNYRESPVWSPPDGVREPFDAWAATSGTDWATYSRERPA